MQRLFANPACPPRENTSLACSPTCRSDHSHPMAPFAAALLAACNTAALTQPRPGRHTAAAPQCPSGAAFPQSTHVQAAWFSGSSGGAASAAACHRHLGRLAAYSASSDNGAALAAAEEQRQQQRRMEQQQLDRTQLDGAIQRAVRKLGGVTSSIDLGQAELEQAIHRAIDEVRPTTGRQGQEYLAGSGLKWAGRASAHQRRCWNTATASAGGCCPSRRVLCASHASLCSRPSTQTGGACCV